MSHIALVGGTLIDGNGAVTTAGSFLPGVLAVLVMTPFFYTGFDTIPQSAEEASEGLDWKKFGMIISASLLAAGLFYVFCISAFGTIFPWKQSVAMPVPALASIEKISMWLYLPMLVIGTLGPLGPMNSFYGATVRIMLAVGRKATCPRASRPSTARPARRRRRTSCSPSPRSWGRSSVATCSSR